MTTEENFKNLFLGAKKVCDQYRKDLGNNVPDCVVDLEQILIDVALEGNQWAEQNLSDWRE